MHGRSLLDRPALGQDVGVESARELAGGRVDAPTARAIDRRTVALLVASGAYVAASLTANVMSVRIVRIAGFSIDAGTLAYPLTFTLRDVVHKVGGRMAARATILATAGFNGLLALGLWAAAQLPADATVTGPAQSSFGPVLLGTWRIVVASIVAQLIAETIDTEVYHRYVLRFGARAQWVVC